MELWQAILIGLFGYLGAKRTPWFFGVTGGWNTIGRPLVAGLIIGIILGDVKSGILAGAAVQAMYIGLVTPGGSLPADINFAAYIGIPLALVSGGGPEYAVALAVPLSFFGIVVFNFLMSFNATFVHKGDKYAEEGNGEGIIRMNILGTVPTFLIRFTTIFLACYFGASAAQTLTNAMPEVVGRIFIVLGRMLPAIGFALLLRQTLSDKKMIIFFLAGFVIVASFNITILSLAVLASCIAVLDTMYRKEAA
ncbi:PTS mannose/fructose/sorbose/N-acetylgalactosamine transporter subunit IIC [Maledivibacter halophilus]|uniref:PTS system, mannose-specific IIC component n=1 Tax=Maledivibacter halophilus TaxID=36842 RepID=A0A1T5M493_9FIRM|nr:PTS sugar transporter subunit IIC [Maledivibacter halophilus]SKC83081.1 PTS system, mannose-specific IIC component [Maledivibacter halophilus]